MRYIASYANDAAIQSAVDAGTLGHPYVALDDQLHKIDWDSKEQSYESQYLTIKALEDGTFYVRSANVYHSKNGGSWETGSSISLSNGDTVRFKHISTTTGETVGSFSGNTIQFNAYGNIESMEYGDDFVGQTSVKIDASTRAKGACSGLFKNCVGLMNVENIILPEIVKGYSFTYIFQGCTSITTAPDILATSYKTTTQPLQYAFDGCSSLNYIKCMLSGKNISLNTWVNGVSSTGTFVKASGATWSTGASGIPSGWTVINA